MRPYLLFLLLVAPLVGWAQVNRTAPLDSAEARQLLAQATRQYPKFAQALRTVRQDPLLKQVVLVRPAGPLNTPATAAPDGTVRLDVRFLEQPRPGFDDNRLVVVLYHEVGHLHYYLAVPPGQRSPEASERAAFDYSLLKTKELAANGDCEPLQTGLRFMLLRSQSDNVADPHVRALKSLVQEPAYAEYQRYASTHCASKP